MCNNLSMPIFCNKCNEPKQQESFSKSNRHKTGFNPTCKECINSKINKWRKENKDKTSSYNKKRTEKLNRVKELEEENKKLKEKIKKLELNNEKMY